MKYSIALLLLLFLAACGEEVPDNMASYAAEESPEGPAGTVAFSNQGHQLVYEAMQRVGDYGDLIAKKDVVYTYTYRTPDGKEDVSIEKYLFDGEYSVGIFEKRSRTLPELEGTLVQGYDGEQFWTTLNGRPISDAAAIQRATFTRKTNFYWFAMNQKLNDPGLNYAYLREQEVDGKRYDVVSITYDENVGVAQDIYQVFINQETKLIDQFLFTVMAAGRSEPLLMRNTYEDFDGVKIATYRKYTPSNWEAEVLEEKWTEEISENVRFDNGLMREDFRLPNS